MAHAIKKRSCCCCLPVRFGVFTFAILGLLGGSLVAAGGIAAVKHTKVGRPVILVEIIMYIILALISIFGLIATSLRRRRLVAVYWAMLTAHLIFSVVAGSFVLNSVFKHAKANIEKCIGDPEDPEYDPDQESICKKAETAIKAGMISILIIVWLIQIYACVVIDKHTKQLAEEEDAMFKEETGRPTW